VDDCTVIMKMLFHQYLEQHKEKSVLDKIASDPILNLKKENAE
jgi:hypothetical protein